MKRFARGGRTKIPTRLGIHLVAAAYGQDPRDVEAWPADLYLEAVAMIPATYTRGMPMGDD